jgi:RHS repeat-associated protein
VRASRESIDNVVVQQRASRSVRKLDRGENLAIPKGCKRLLDHLGSTAYVTDARGQVYQHIEYFPSGETWVEEATNTQRTPYRFADKELDEESGLYYFGARYYDPRTSSWQSADPATMEYLDGGGLGGVYNSLNLAAYAHAGHNPLKYVDLDGRVFTFEDEALEREVDNMEKYLRKSPHAADVIDRLRSASPRWHISRGEFEFRPNQGQRGGNIQVDPEMGLKTTRGKVQSPALGYLHELGHADNHYRDPVEHKKRSNTKSRHFENQEEKHVIKKLEKPVAKDLGEPTRNDHYGDDVKVKGSTSRVVK